jgi:hypothetical protein
MPDPTLTWLFFALCRYVESQRLLPIQNSGEPEILRPLWQGLAPMLTDWSANTPPPSPPQEGFSGLIERITFHSEETGFAVLRVKVKGHRELVTVVGALASVNVGEWITAQGNWVQDKEHGLQRTSPNLDAWEAAGTRSRITKSMQPKSY